jgi:hypothetical protein
MSHVSAMLQSTGLLVGDSEVFPRGNGFSIFSIALTLCPPLCFSVFRGGTCEARGLKREAKKGLASATREGHN